MIKMIWLTAFFISINYITRKMDFSPIIAQLSNHKIRI